MAPPLRPPRRSRPPARRWPLRAAKFFERVHRPSELRFGNFQMSTAVTSQMVKELREKTGAGLLDCQKALTESLAYTEVPIPTLPQTRAASAANNPDRPSHEGLIDCYIHLGGKVGA